MLLVSSILASRRRDAEKPLQPRLCELFLCAQTSKEQGRAQGATDCSSPYPSPLRFVSARWLEPGCVLVPTTVPSTQTRSISRLRCASADPQQPSRQSHTANVTNTVTRRSLLSSVGAGASIQPWVSTDTAQHSAASLSKAQCNKAASLKRDRPDGGRTRKQRNITRHREPQAHTRSIRCALSLSLSARACPPRFSFSCPPRALCVCCRLVVVRVR